MILFLHDLHGKNAFHVQKCHRRRAWTTIAEEIFGFDLCLCKCLETWLFEKLDLSLSLLAMTCLFLILVFKTFLRL